MSSADKPLVWLHGEIQTPPLSAEARIEAGYLLRKLQRGATLTLPYSRPLRVIGARVHELRINDRQVTWRIYRIDEDAVILADVCSKKRRKFRRRWLTAVDSDCCVMTNYKEGEIMHSSKRERLEANGWKVGGAQEFLGLSSEEMAYIEVKLALSRKVREQRKHRELTQKEVSALIGSSQSRVAKMEAGDPTVSIDLLVKTLIALGISRDELALTIGAGALAQF